MTTGTPLVFESANVVIPRTSATTCDTYRNGTLITTGTTTCYDGGDRIYVAGGAVTVTRAAWIEVAGRHDPGGRLGDLPGQAPAHDLRPSLRREPGRRAQTYTDFLRVAVLIQATDDDTTFQVDLDGDGSWDLLDPNGDSAAGLDHRHPEPGQTFLLDDASAGRTAGAARHH